MLNIANKLHVSGQGVKEPLARHWFAQILEGVKHMHERGFAHMDLKLDNLLLDERLNVKITDFGFTLKPDPEGNTQFQFYTP